MIFLHHVMFYLILKDVIKYKNFELLHNAINTCCIMFQKTIFHHKYVKKLF